MKTVLKIIDIQWNKGRNKVNKNQTVPKIIDIQWNKGRNKVGTIRASRHVILTGARGTDHPLFSNFLLTNLFSITFLYFFIISSLFPYFNLFVSIFIQSYVNIKLHVSTQYIDTNNTQDMQLGKVPNF